MVSGADVRQALQAGLWKALVDGSGRAAMRATCRDARGMVDELHDSAVMPVGPDTWGSAAAIAAYHRKLGAVLSLHVRYSRGGEAAEVSAEPEADEHELPVQFVVAYSAALGAALPADSCTITMTSERQLPTPFMAVLLARVVPRVERLDMALGSYDNLAQLLTLMGPCTHLRSLRLLPADGGQGGRSVHLMGCHYEGSVLEALCGLTRLHALSGPWVMRHSALRRLCAALPGLTTLGFRWLDLFGASGACISRQLHTLAGWRHSAWDDARSQPASHPWHLLDSSAGSISAVHSLQSSLPALHSLDSVVLDASHSYSEELPAVVAAVQRFAACAERWACTVVFHCDGLEVRQRLAQGSLASVQHAVVQMGATMPADAAACLRSLVAAAPNITTLAVSCYFCGESPGELAEMLEPLRRAARMHSLRLADWTESSMRAGGTALSLAEAVRGLVRPDAEGECCSALKRVRLAGVEPGDLQACRLALADDGVNVSVDACTW